MTSGVETPKSGRREVLARLVEATPGAYGWGHWALSAPLVLFMGWLWVDMFGAITSIPWRPMAFLFGALVYILLILPPVGYGAHRFVTSFPRLFQQAGWTVHPLESLRPAEQYTVKYVFTERERAATDSRRVLLRVAQGLVYVEIGAILAGFIAMVPLFFSAIEYGL